MKKNIYKFLIFFMVFALSLLTSCNKQQISVDTDIVNLKVGETYKLNVVLVESKIRYPEFHYEISDSSIISFLDNVITAHSTGTAKITISVLNTKVDPVIVTVNVTEAPKPTKIKSETNLELILGETHKIEYSVEPFNASKDVLFSSADNNVLSVDEDGVITPKDLGETFVTIKSKENPNVKLRVNIEVVLPKVEKIECENELVLGYNETKQITYSITPLLAVQDVYYKSLDENIVTVDEAGLITSLKPGKTKIILTSVDDERVTHEINVSVEGTLATNFTAVDEINLSLGETKLIEYNISPADAYQKIEYTVSNKEAIEVNDGILTAKKAGTYTVTLKTIDGTNLRNTVTVNITGDELPVVSLSESIDKDMEINIFEHFDPLDGVRIFDAEDGELTKTAKNTNNVNTDEYGTYNVIYEVVDSDGNSLIYERIITIVWDYNVTFIGHAGSLYGAMNSEEAILYAAKELKYTAIEIDLKQTKDGVFVLSHDETFAGYELGQYNWAELKDVEVTVTRSPGISNPAPASSYTAKLCTLKRYLEICKEYNITAVIELKTSAGISNWTEQNRPDTSRMPALIEEIEKAGMINNIIFLTSQYECLAWTRRNGYDFIPCQYLVSSCENQTYLDTCIKYNLDISFNVRDGVKNSSTWIKKYKDAGLQVSTYTFEQWASYKEIQEWIDKGVDFVTTDWHNPKELELPKDE